MKLGNYAEIAGFTKKINNPGVAEGITGKIAIGKADGANHFTMRVFTLAPGGFTPRHIHDWEHEVYFVKGNGEAYDAATKTYVPVTAGTIVYVPANEDHQFRNASKTDELVFICLVPQGENIPEI